MLYRQSQVLLREWRNPAFRSRTPSIRCDFSCRSPSPCSHRTCQHAAHAPRLAPRRTRVLECVARATSKPMPIPSVHRGQGSQRAKRYRSAGEPFNPHACTRAPPCCPCASNALIHLVDACTHAQCAGMSRRTSAQLLSTCALDQTPAAVACGVRGLQDHVPTVLRYWESAMAGGGCDCDCVSYLHVTARARAAARPS